MKVRMITPGTREKFKGLIDPEIYAEMEAGHPVTAIGLSDDKKPVGAIAGKLENEHVFSVRSLYVSPDHRRQGGATMLTAALERLLDTKDALALISYIEEDDEDSQALTAFIESRDCVLENGLERMYRGTVGDFMKSGLFVKGFKNKDIRSLVDFEKASVTGLKKNIRKLFAGDEMKFLQKFRNVAGLSFASMKNDELQGVLLTGYAPDHPDEPVIVLSELNDPHVIGGLLNAFLISIREMMGDDTYIRFPVMDDRFDRMMSAIHGVRNIQHNYLF